MVRFSIFLSSVLCLLFSGCGFQPVHKQSVRNAAMHAVDVPILKGSRTEQIFSNTLADLLNPESTEAAKRYQLDLKFKYEEIPAVIQQDRKITRYRITLTANYSLKEGETEITKGTVKTRTSYDDLTSEFGSYSAQVDAQERAAQELAQMVYQRLQGFWER